MGQFLTGLVTPSLWNDSCKKSSLLRIQTCDIGDLYRLSLKEDMPVSFNTTMSGKSLGTSSIINILLGKDKKKKGKEIVGEALVSCSNTPQTPRYKNHPSQPVTHEGICMCACVCVCVCVPVACSSQSTP
jgi:hypothetical protein